MSNSSIPLFIVDTARWHGKGDADFIVCTDPDNGFIARVDVIDKDVSDSIDDTICIGYGNRGYKLRLEIVRITGRNPEPSKVQGLMKRACDYYTDNRQAVVNTDNPSTVDCVKFLNVLIEGNRQNLQDEADQRRKKTVETSLRMLAAIRLKLLE